MRSALAAIMNPGASAFATPTHDSGVLSGWAKMTGT
jgi:hypothetical protein